MSNQKEKLFTDFPSVTTEQWMEKVTEDLKGADFQKKLVWKTNEGFNVNPFYRAENIEGYAWTDNLPGKFPYVRGTKKDNTWFVRQEIDVQDYAEANKKALSLLEKGVTSFGFKLPKNNLSAENIATLLNGISPEKVELNFKTCISKTIEMAKLVVDYVRDQNLDVMKCFGSIEFDPFRKILKKGKDASGWEDQVVEIVNISAPLPRYRVISVTGNMISDAGAYSYQELGYSLSYGNQVLGTLIEKGIDPAMAAKKIKFEFGVGSNYFMEIAKFRAARWLWAEIVNAYNPPCKNECDNKAENGTCRCAAKMNIHATTSRFNQSLYDPYVNLLRTQTESMSATIGVVDSLTVRPFDEAFETPTEFAERIAVNQQLILKEESHFNKITDPAAGSYYVENLTLSLAQQAWKLFLETEEVGFYESLKVGTVQDAINSSSEARVKALSSRKEVLVGTNQYPNFTETMSEKIVEKSCSRCGCGDNAPFKKLSTSRLAESFNELRLATEANNNTPKVFMLTIGNLAMRLARAQFSSNFFAVAGYEIIDNIGFDTVEEGVKAAREKNADVIVLCSSDDEYSELAPKAYELVKNGNEIFVVAGAPACMEELKAIGIEHFINVRSNVLDTLKKFNEKLLK
ncbi:MAG: methylmalonyl-CoA mutase family protein [Dysgonamonadaceae bacterium]|jgi:methylmalonyl-CoA mutase|nr:methylmalonyl-CoA mutase family protein [Dysgonamonadaceae bacterium]MDD3308651.1 methylmalonyl-CoA mutase family protein [Dysgonamonadaceae bacterium]MDD3899757.1 methylmalonyl-CoA mutase family protein [Dysgonamonadaceae bacterium]MDD4397964.1 methylmalonyl-CoA mutase family protein [Dysgonamonadaceae bacterium]MEA5080201.1 methylmalonyl-CoA mutase family protein [Dysgonamonadaceae bacterium]